jgi:hypothetical protein
VGKVLERSHPVLVQGALTADQQHRALRAQGVGHAGDRVGGSGPGRDHRTARPAGHARIAVSGMGRDLLVTNVDDLDALVDAPVVDVDDVTAAKREDGVDPLGPESLGDEMAPGNGPGLDVPRAGWLLLLIGGRRGCHVDSPSISDGMTCGGKLGR